MSYGCIYIYTYTHIYGMWMYMVCSLPGDVHIQGTVFSDPVSHGCANEGFGDFFVSFLNQNGSVADKVHRLNVTYCALAVWLMWKLWPFFLYIYINTCIYTYCLLLVQCVFPLPILLCLGGSVCLNILYQATLVWGSTAEPPYDTKIYTQDMRLFENIVSLFLF